MKTFNDNIPLALADIAKIVYPGDPMSKRRLRSDVDVRTAISCQLRRRGYTVNQIGDFYGLHHSGITHMGKLHNALMKVDKAYRERYYKFIGLIVQSNMDSLLEKEEIKTEIKRITRELLTLGLTVDEATEFWNECVNEFKNK